MVIAQAVNLIWKLQAGIMPSVPLGWTPRIQIEVFLQKCEFSADLCKSLPNFPSFSLCGNVSACPLNVWIQTWVESVVRNYKFGGGAVVLGCFLENKIF